MMGGQPACGREIRRPFSDFQNKSRALWRLRRAASSGLPLNTFVQIVFELLNDGVPYSPLKTMMPLGDPSLQAYIFNDDEMQKWRAGYKHYVIDAPTSISGRRIELTELAGAACSRSVWSHEQTMLPNFHRSEGYNEFFRHLGYHHVLGGMMTEGGEWRGWVPLWRAAEMKPFTRDDTAFLEAALPHIAHGIAAAGNFEPDAAGSIFVPRRERNIGVVLIEPAGGVAGMDEVARSIFQRLALFEKDPAWFGVDGLSPALGYVARALRTVFQVQDRVPWNAAAPTTAIHFHHSGMVLRLRAVALGGSEGRGCVTVLVERGETSEHRRLRLRNRYGLSEREFELLEMSASALYPREIAARMNVGIGTLKSYLRRLSDKLALEGVSSLRSFARDLRL